MKEKEFLYVGYYTAESGEIVLKIGTTNDLAKRRTQHNNYYRNRAAHYRMPKQNTFEYLWNLPLSKYNTLRYEDKNKQMWQEQGIGEFIHNDRFVVNKNLAEVTIQIRKSYTIPLSF